MPLNITIDHARSNHGSAHSSVSEGEGVEGVGLSSHSGSGSQELSDTSPDPDWRGAQHLSYPEEEVQPSDSASRPRSAHRIRQDPPRAHSSSRPSRRHSMRDPEAIPYRPRERPIPRPESVEPADFELGYTVRPGAPQRHSFYGGPMGYAHSSSSGASYAPYPPVNHPPSSQLVQYGPQAMHYAPPYPHPQPQIAPPHAPAPNFYSHGHVSPPPMNHPMGAPVHSPFAPSPIVPHEPMAYHHGGPGYFPALQPSYPMAPPSMFPTFQAPQHRRSPTQVGSSPPPAEKKEDKESAEEIYKRFQKMLEDRAAKDKAEFEAREAEKEAKIKAEAAAKAAAEERQASDKKIAADAAAAATAAAEESAAKKAAEEAEKAKKALEEAAEKAEAEKAAAIAAAKPPPPAEKKAPIKFKDAVGRKFSFPFHLCAKWKGMEDLIRQAFLHVDVIGQHVADGHYDLVGPNGDIILPQVWETVIEPDWLITMHMWPMPEKPKTPDLPPLGGDDEVLVLDDILKPTKGGGKKGAAGAPKSSILPPPPPGPPRRGSIPPLAPDAPKPNIAAKKTGSKPKPKPGGGWSIFGGGKQQKVVSKPAAAKTKAKK